MKPSTHILGICGTFMGGLAQLARELGYRVSGSDQGIYPPMSEQLEHSGIVLTQGFAAAQLDAIDAAAQIIVGNALTRGHPVVERLLSEKRALISGPQWLYENVLATRQVLAVAGTHGKTTTSSILTWILQHAGLDPGFLIGGVPGNFGISARLGTGPFVIEADEYDSAFFDKRSKFIHYRPDVLVLNNLEFDHADIFRDLDDIQRQFHHLVRTVAQRGQILAGTPDAALDTVLQMGCWSHVQRYGVRVNPVENLRAEVSVESAPQWQVSLDSADASRFTIHAPDGATRAVHWQLIGQHNAMNALAAVSAACSIGVGLATACDALADFQSPRRRLELRATIDGVRIFDDFAHHPTAVCATLGALRAAVGQARIVAVLDPASNTMRMGVHRETLAPALREADRVLLHQPSGLRFALQDVADEVRAPTSVHDSVADIVNHLCAEVLPGDHVLIMSNGGFGGIHGLLATALAEARSTSTISTPSKAIDAPPANTRKTT
ncbi:MAG: UDP-N-acetylmuramate: L-alanyl-gamma-D-glutamyl-meso-diaminopimelate ligase [Gammaproteobacteria bacterium]